MFILIINIDMNKYTTRDALNDITEKQVITSYDYNEVYEMIKKIADYDIVILRDLERNFPDKYTEKISELRSSYWKKYEHDKIFYRALFESDGEFYYYGGNNIYKFGDKFPDVLMQVIKIIYEDVKSETYIKPKNFIGELFGNHIGFNFSDAKLDIKWFTKMELTYEQLQQIDPDNLLSPEGISAKKRFFKNRNEYLRQYTKNIL
jgi:hypothetical protein